MRLFLTSAVLLSVVIAVQLISASNGLCQNTVPDIVLVNGRIFTASEAHPYAEAIAIKGKEIVALDTTQKIDALAGPLTQRIDLGGRLVIPGMRDTHIHYYGDPLPSVTTVDFGDWDPSCEHVLEVLQKQIRTSPPENLITGNMGVTAFFDAKCTPSALDAIAPNRAVFLTSLTPHAAMLNQAAVKWFGVSVDAPPTLAGWFGKDMRSKKWDGVVHESEAFRLYPKMNSDSSQNDERLRTFLLQEAKYGVTSNTLLEPDPAARVQQLARIDAPNRVRVVPFAQYEIGTSRRKLEQPSVPNQIADRVSVNGQKWVLDGSPIERSAALRAPYTDAPNTSGQLDYPETEIRGILEDALRQNQPLLLHAVGDRTIEAILNQMEATGGAKVWSKRRLRIEHGDGLAGNLLARAKALGVIVAENPLHFSNGLLTLQRFGQQRASEWMPFRTLLDTGIPLVIASDGGYGSPGLSPFLNIQLASTYPARPSEAISRQQAVIALTRTAAYSEFVDDRLGTLEVGKLADLAVLSQNIFEVTADELPKTESLMTIIGGKIAYRRTPGLLDLKNAR